MFTTVAAYCDPFEAQLALGRLQAEGIPARLDDTGTAIANWEWRLAIGGMRLRVPDAQVLHARRVLAALDAGEYALEDTAGDEAAAGAGAAGGFADAGTGARAGAGADTGAGVTAGAQDAGAFESPDRESLSSRLAWAALMLLGLPLPWRRRRGDDAVVRRA